jgi:hypothetical protein
LETQKGSIKFAGSGNLDKMKKAGAKASAILEY